MKVSFIVPVVIAVVALRVALYRRRRNRRLDGPKASTNRRGLEVLLGDAGMVATREIRERIRGRIFWVGTIVVLIVVGASILIPKIHSSSAPSVQKIGVVGAMSPQAVQLVHAAAVRNGDRIKLVPEASTAAAKAGLNKGDLDLAVVDDQMVLVNDPVGSKNAAADPGLVTDVAAYLGVIKAYESAGITSSQATAIDQANPVPVHSLTKHSAAAVKATSVIGIVLLFVMLTQYCTWILIGVMQEKSSRVVEVLLATLRPIQLLGGKVLGIGLVALGQATLIVGFALALSEAVGSNLLHGGAPVALLSELLWLILGYAFYCWVYAAAGSTAERQDQVQTLALPLMIPMLIGYVYSVTVASTGNAGLLFKILAYLPPTAPFCMSVLVGLGDVAWWQFTISALITVAATVGTALFAARIYRRAVLRTGGRVRLRELMPRHAD